jgi:hypothetical protein
MNLEQLILISVAGFLASWVHVVIGLWAHRIGMIPLNLSKAMSKLNFDPDYQEKPPYTRGTIIVQINGIVFALVYAKLIGPYLPGIPVVRGLIFAGILFLISQLFFIPVFLREGFFLSKLHPRAWMTAAMIHIVYGVILGWLCPILVKPY